MQWFFLASAAVLEIAATNFLPMTHRFTRPAPTAIVCAMYAATVFMLSRAVMEMDIAVAYTVWSALGIVVIAGVGAAIRNERLDLVQWAGLIVVIAGITVMNIGG